MPQKLGRAMDLAVQSRRVEVQDGTDTVAAFRPATTTIFLRYTSNDRTM
jgi:hypothetical protein